jgi:hypothetical protein
MISTAEKGTNKLSTELHLKKMCGLMWCNIGDTALSTIDASDSFRKFSKPVLTREYWSALHPFSAEGAYANFLMDEGGNHCTPTKIKVKYDPENLFNLSKSEY